MIKILYIMTLVCCFKCRCKLIIYIVSVSESVEWMPCTIYWDCYFHFQVFHVTTDSDVGTRLIFLQVSCEVSIEGAVLKVPLQFHLIHFKCVQRKSRPAYQNNTLFHVWNFLMLLL